MSKILRRPMFRGGRVESRGTGITSGLMNGGRVGLANSYPGTAGQAQRAQALAGLTKPTTGAELLKLNPNLQINPYSTYLPSDQESIGAGFGFMSPGRQFTEQYLEFMKPEETGYETNAEGDPIRDASGNLIPLQKSKSSDFRTFLEQQRTKKITGSDTQGSEEQYGIKDTDKVKPVYNSEGKITGYKGTGKSVAENIPEGGNVPGVKSEKEEPVEYTVEDYIKMLGGDKARRRDLGDTLGRLSASALKRPARGETRGITDVLADYMAAEVAAGPGRAEKIEQAAATLDIKDKIASKRAGEQLKQTLAGIDYKIGATMSAQKAAESLANKTWIDSLKYVSENLYKGTGKGLDSTSVIEDTLRLKFQKPVKKFTVASETEIPNLQISEGFSIVVLPDGSKKIYEVTGNSARERTDLRV